MLILIDTNIVVEHGWRVKEKKPVEGVHVAVNVKNSVTRISTDLLLRPIAWSRFAIRSA